MLTRIVFGLSGACLFVAKLAIAAMTLLTVADVVLRMLFRAPVPGTYELVGMLGAIGVAGALPSRARTGVLLRRNGDRALHRSDSDACAACARREVSLHACARRSVSSRHRSDEERVSGHGHPAHAAVDCLRAVNDGTIAVTAVATVQFSELSQGHTSVSPEMADLAV